MLTPIQNAGDHSPELQIGTAPAYMSDSLGHILPASIPDFAQMSANPKDKRPVLQGRL